MRRHGGGAPGEVVRVPDLGVEELEARDERLSGASIGGVSAMSGPRRSAGVT